MTKRRMFLMYCAYAPFIHAIGGVMLAVAINHPDPFSFAYTQLLFSLPFSAWFLAETSWFYCNVIASTLGAIAHTLIWGFLYVHKVVSDAIGKPPLLPDDDVAIFFLVGCLVFVSISLLMTWDLMKREENAPLGIG